MKFTVKAAGNAPKEALDYFRRKELAPDLDMDEVWGEEHDYAFAVANVAGRDLLEGFRSAVEAAIAEGLTYEQFSGRLDDVLDALGWWVADPAKPDAKTAPHRLRVVYDTNLRVARAAGQWTRVQRTKSALPYLTYSLGPSARHRPVHETWAGTTLPVDDDWWSSHMPPNGYGCKCRVRQISRSEADDLGVSSAPPAGDPDPGWDHNPGQAPRVP